MKTPLCYQRTEYDCGPTTLLNALSFQFEREDIPPELVRLVTTYATDAFSLGGEGGRRGEHGKGGTSRLAMMFVSGWLNEYGKATGFPVESEYLAGRSATASLGGRISLALQEGAAVVARVMHGADEHYILLTGLSDGLVSAWDPYYMGRPVGAAPEAPAEAAPGAPAGAAPEAPGAPADAPAATFSCAPPGIPADVEWVDGRPFHSNRRFPVARLDDAGAGLYAMGPPERREAVVLFNARTRRRGQYEPEYAI